MAGECLYICNIGPVAFGMVLRLSHLDIYIGSHGTDVLTPFSHYGPGFFGFFQEQNDKIANGSIHEDGAHYLHLDTLGIVSGLVDVVVQGESLISYPYNNVSALQMPHALNGYEPRSRSDSTNFRATGFTSSTSLYTRSCCTTGPDRMVVRNKSQRAKML